MRKQFKPLSVSVEYAHVEDTYAKEQDGEYYRITCDSPELTEPQMIKCKGDEEFLRLLKLILNSGVNFDLKE